MGHPRRHFHQGYPLFITNRLAQGLPFVPNHFVNSLILGILAKAQSAYPSITICAAVFLGNHYHLVMVPTGDPSETSGFMNLFDGELAKMVKKLLGTKTNVKIWAQRYHAAILCDPEATIKKMAYLFANPVAANLVERAADWFGVTTYSPDLKATRSSQKYIPPSKIPSLPNAPFTKRSLRKLLEDWENTERFHHSLTIDPLAWMKSFRACQTTEEKTVRTKLSQAISDIEQEGIKDRKMSGRKLPDKILLQFQNPHKSFKSTNFGRRTYCICTCSELRKLFVDTYREFCSKCCDVWANWKAGNFSYSYPPGAFIPPRAPIANLIPAPL